MILAWLPACGEGVVSRCLLGGLWYPTCLPACAMRSAYTAVKPLELQQLASCYGGGNGARSAGSWAGLRGCTLPAALALLTAPARCPRAERGACERCAAKREAGESPQQAGRESVWWGISFPRGGEVRLQWEAQPTEGAVQLGVQVHRDPAQCRFYTYGI